MLSFKINIINYNYIAFSSIILILVFFIISEVFSLNSRSKTISKAKVIGENKVMSQKLKVRIEIGNSSWKESEVL